MGLLSESCVDCTFGSVQIGYHHVEGFRNSSFTAVPEKAAGFSTLKDHVQAIGLAFLAY